MAERILDVKQLQTSFFSEDGEARAVDGVNFSIDAGEVLGIVGESGSGKSVTSMSIMRLIPTPPGKIKGGQILFRGEDLLKKSPEAMRKIRGNDIAMIFQEPMTALNPVYTVGDQIAEAVILHQHLSRHDAWDKATEMLRLVGIPAPEKRVRDFPHNMSGGMRQRVMIAMALSCNPKLLIADEPTTALDVTIQAQILDLMKKLQEEFHTAIMFITHDLGVVAEMTNRVAVMYAGRVVEESTTAELFEQPLHPYTQGLLDSIPRLDQPVSERLHVIDGSVPNLTNLPQGCAFAPRCPKAMDICRQQRPQLTPVGENRQVSCWLYSNPNAVGHDEKEETAL
ncbi:MAG: ABC transporter ATP-binding protein [Firmicutes bacterium]|nr:ABC transporter ATP-binding protein [Bacillota bacterium]